MKLWFAWVGHKKDNDGKSHLWGILSRHEGPVTYRYVFWCSIGKKKTNVFLEQKQQDIGTLSGKRLQKLSEGYVDIKQDVIERRWPQVMDDIEMQFMMEKLSG